jgi:signal transduction histidine kinase
MDGIILLPFFFMGRFFVRETLKPIGDNIDAMNHFIHDAGHELKTPLAIMSGNLQLLRDTKTKDMTLIEESI